MQNTQEIIYNALKKSKRNKQLTPSLKNAIEEVIGGQQFIGRKKFLTGKNTTVMMIDSMGEKITLKISGDESAWKIDRMNMPVNYEEELDVMNEDRIGEKLYDPIDESEIDDTKVVSTNPLAYLKMEADGKSYLCNSEGDKVEVSEKTFKRF